MTSNIGLASYFLMCHLITCCFLRHHIYDRPRPLTPFRYSDDSTLLNDYPFYVNDLIPPCIAVNISTSAVTVRVSRDAGSKLACLFLQADICVCSLADDGCALAVTRGTASFFAKLLNKHLCLGRRLLHCSA